MTHTLISRDQPINETTRCHQQVKILSFLEGELKKEERVCFLKHLNNCKVCQSSLKVLQQDYDLIENLIPHIERETEFVNSLSFEVKEILDIHFKDLAKDQKSNISKDSKFNEFVSKVTDTVGIKGILNNLTLNN